jgi:hypothetical protein
MPVGGTAPVWTNEADLPYRAFPGESVAVSIPLVGEGQDGSHVPRGVYRLRLLLQQVGGARVALPSVDVEIEVEVRRAEVWINVR